MKLQQQQKTVALTAIVNAAANHRHVAIRPQQPAHSNTARTPGIRVRTSPMHSGQFEDAATQAATTWPQQSQWEIFGSDYMEPGSENWAGAGDGVYMQPRIYGRFFSDVDPDEERNNEVGDGTEQ